MNRVHTMTFRLFVASFLCLSLFCSELQGANAVAIAGDHAAVRNQTGQPGRRIRLLLNRRHRYQRE